MKGMLQDANAGQRARLELVAFLKQAVAKAFLEIGRRCDVCVRMMNYEEVGSKVVPKGRMQIVRIGVQGLVERRQCMILVVH